MNGFETFLSSCKRSVAQGASEARSTKLRPKKADLKPHAQRVEAILHKEVPRAFELYGVPVNGITMGLFTSVIADVWNGRIETIPHAVNVAALRVSKAIGR